MAIMNTSENTRTASKVPTRTASKVLTRTASKVPTRTASTVPTRATESKPLPLSEEKMESHNLEIEKSLNTPNAKLDLAKENDFDKYYDITLSPDNKYFQVKVKDAGLFCVNPNLATIKSDFGLKDGVLAQKGNIPHDNEDVIPSSSYGAGFDSIEIPVGKTINIPVSEVNINGSPRGAFSRYISYLAN